jgi:hypothetical protein
MRGRANGAAKELPTLTIDEASVQAGFKISLPEPATLPPGLSGPPRISVIPASNHKFVFSRSKTLAFLQSQNHAEVAVPAKFDGASLSVSVPAAALLQYGAASSRDALVVGEAGTITVSVEGNVTLDEFSQFLQSLPVSVVPQSTKNVLANMKGLGESVPIPVPVDKVNWQRKNFARYARDGILLDDKSGAGSAALVQAGGYWYGVAGSVKSTDVTNIVDNIPPIVGHS